MIFYSTTVINKLFVNRGTLLKKGSRVPTIFDARITDATGNWHSHTISPESLTFKIKEFFAELHFSFSKIIKPSIKRVKKVGSLNHKYNLFFIFFICHISRSSHPPKCFTLLSSSRSPKSVRIHQLQFSSLSLLQNLNNHSRGLRNMCSHTSH